MAATVTLLAPAATGQYAPRSGTVYTPNSLGLLVGVPITDVSDLESMGCVVVSTPVNVGAAGTGVTAAEFGDVYNHTTILTLGAGAVLPAIVGGTNLGIGKLLYTLPAGAQLITSSHMAVAITQTAGHINTDAPVVGLGMTVASGAVVVLSGTAGFQSIQAGKAAADCNGTATVQTTLATASPFGLISEIGGTKTVYFNAAIGWTAGGDPAAILTGSVILNWRTLS